MKMNTDFERMADQAIVIKRYWDQSDGSHPEIHKMDEEVHIMVRNCIDAFVQHDTSLAEQTIKDDQLINQINKDLALKYIEEMKSETLSFEEGFALVRVIKNLERIADLATNIAEDVIFLERGMDVRHLDPMRKINHNEKA
jgi:phosphate transport system protein